MKIKPLTIIRIGLAFAFLANAFTAFVSPHDFMDLLNASFVHNLIPIASSLSVFLIGINDTLVAALLFSGGKRARLIEWWAIIWLVGVLVIKATGGSYFDALEEVAFVTMVASLIIDAKSAVDIHS